MSSTVHTLTAQAKVDGFNAGYGKDVLRYKFCKDAGHCDFQVKLNDGWMCLHNGHLSNYDVLKTALQLLKQEKKR
jgi:hypothetical protein